MTLNADETKINDLKAKANFKKFTEDHRPFLCKQVIPNKLHKSIQNLKN